MAEEKVSICMFDSEHYCEVLARLSLEFSGDEHLSLIFGELLPKYCESCPHLKQLEKT